MIIPPFALFIIGLLFIYNGWQMRTRRLQLGSSWGFRTEETQISTAVWKESHAAGGLVVMVGGLGAEIAGAILLLIPSRDMTISLMVTVCAIAWVALLYMAAKGRVVESAQRIHRRQQRAADSANSADSAGA